MSPVYNIKKVSIEKIKPNDYSINYMCEKEYRLLELSILRDGITLPILCSYDKEKDIYEIIDGFYRYKIIKENEIIRKRENGVIPVIVLPKNQKNQMATHIRHNRAKGDFTLEAMKKFLLKLKELNISDEILEKEYGFCKDEIYRLKQLTGIKSLFPQKDFSKSWVVVN